MPTFSIVIVCKTFADCNILIAQCIVFGAVLSGFCFLSISVKSRDVSDFIHLRITGGYFGAKRRETFEILEEIQQNPSEI